ncbi:MAG: hypothetical protein ACRETA_01180 [Gammaproteobacteria bacterium]
MKITGWHLAYALHGVVVQLNEAGNNDVEHRGRLETAAEILAQELEDRFREIEDRPPSARKAAAARRKIAGDGGFPHDQPEKLQ